MTWSAPMSRQYLAFSALPTVAMVLAPKALQSWIAVSPMPLEPPWIRIVSPAARCARSKTLFQTVKYVSGRLAASSAYMPRGNGRQQLAGVVQYSAYPPPGVSAHAMSPTRHSVTPSPRATIFPATSRPMIGEASGGGGYDPALWMQSGRLTPA